MLVDRGFKASMSNEVVVWSIAFLSDHTIFSGDSAGRVQMWDGVTGTMVKSHLVTKWDVMALSLSGVSVYNQLVHQAQRQTEPVTWLIYLDMFHRMRAV